MTKATTSSNSSPSDRASTSSARLAAALHTSTGPAHLDFGIEDIDPERHGRFDLIYSLNVLEHVDNWRLALDAACRVLGPRGKLIVSCPNYSVPYEPHLGIPLVPFRPGLTARLLPGRVTETGLWKSLNWVTHRQVRRWADHRKASITFERGSLTRVSNRLNDDPEFRKRHGPLLRATARALRVTRGDRVLGALPPAMVTPMEFVVETR